MICLRQLRAIARNASAVVISDLISTSPPFSTTTSDLRQELEAALGLGLDGKPERQRLGQSAGEREQLGRIAALKFKLDFADGDLACAGDDFALVDGDLDLGAAMGDAAKRPAHARLEQRPERSAARARQQGMEGRAVDDFEVGSRPGISRSHSKRSSRSALLCIALTVWR